MQTHTDNVSPGVIQGIAILRHRRFVVEIRFRWAERESEGDSRKTHVTFDGFKSKTVDSDPIYHL